MLNASVSVGHVGPSTTQGSSLSGRNGGFPSFRLMDTISMDTVGPHTFAPLRFTTLDPSIWNNGVRPQLFHPTLISPYTPEDDESTSTHSTIDAPPLPAIEDFKAEAPRNKNLKRPSPKDLPNSFLPYKQREITSSFHDNGSAGTPTHLSPEYLRRIVEAEPRMTEAASILLDMRSLAPTKSPANGDEKTQSELCMLTRETSASTMATDLCILTRDTSVSSMSAADTQSHSDSPMLLSEEKPKATTRSVTPSPSGMRLALPEDAQELNSLHCFVRAELLELFALPGAHDEIASFDKESAHSRSSNRRNNTNVQGRNCSGRVGLRCVYCAHLPRRARSGSTMSSFYPKSLTDIYRSVCTWQRIHFRSCRHIPPQVREGYAHLKDSDRTRGKTRYWVSSARRLGLVDVDSDRGGICFASKPSNDAH